MKKTSILASACLLAVSHLSLANNQTAAAQTEAYFNSIQNNTTALTTFLKKMPKGGDLHIHLDGATYVENMIHYGSTEGFCINPQNDDATQTLHCQPNDNFKNLINEPNLYNSILGAWSMENYKHFNSGSLNHFFATFLKFEPIIPANTANIIAEIANGAGVQNENYVEIMLANFMLGIFTPNNTDPASALGDKVGFNANFAIMQKKLEQQGLNDIVKKAVTRINQIDAEAQTIMQCGTKTAKAGCGVKIRYQYLAFRDLPPQEFYAQLAEAFAVANSDAKVVGINIVLPENLPTALNDYNLQMHMIGYQHSLYPKVHITLHAGELAAGEVPAKDLTFHIRNAIEIAHAERIGHGADIAYETNSAQLLKLMAEKQVLVEINLTSNAEILGLTGTKHPFMLYLKSGVPVALSTDDEGVLRTNLTNEFLRATTTYHLSYSTLKLLARNSLTYSFLPGQSLWLNPQLAIPVSACTKDQIGSDQLDASCQAFLKQSEKARQQWLLEKQFHQFEAGF